MPRVQMNEKSAIDMYIDGLTQNFENRKSLTVCEACTKNLLAVCEKYDMMHRFVIEIV